MSSPGVVDGFSCHRFRLSQLCCYCVPGVCVGGLTTSGMSCLCIVLVLLPGLFVVFVAQCVILRSSRDWLFFFAVGLGGVALSVGFVGLGGSLGWAPLPTSVLPPWVAFWWGVFVVGVFRVLGLLCVLWFCGVSCIFWVGGSVAFVDLLSFRGRLWLLSSALFVLAGWRRLRVRRGDSGFWSCFPRAGLFWPLLGASSS